MADFLPFMLNGQDGWVVTFGSSVYGSFFDESERVLADDPFCVAGYTFKSTEYKQFCRDWRKMLESAIPGRRLKFMHMNDLIGHKKQFDGLPLPPRVKCLEAAVDLICEHALIVSGALVDQKEFEAKAGPDWPSTFGGSYTMLCQRAAQTTATWLQTKKRYQPILYTFEAGHKWEYQTNEMFRGIGRVEFLRRLYQYGHHTFAEKAACYGAQAADLAAWTSVRIRVGDIEAPALQAFIPALERLVRRFHIRGDAMVRFLRGDTLQSFIDEQKEHVITDELKINVGTAKLKFR